MLQILVYFTRKFDTNRSESMIKYKKTYEIFIFQDFVEL
jgi:hypothetical protein